MKAKPLATWFSKLETIYQFLIVVGGILGIVAGGLATTAGLSVRVVREIVREEVGPVRDMSEFNLRASGKWDEYVREREKQEKDRKVIDGRRASLPDNTRWMPN